MDTIKPEQLRAMHEFTTDLSFKPVGTTLTIDQETHDNLHLLELYLHTQMFTRETAPIHMESFQETFKRMYPKEQK